MERPKLERKLRRAGYEVQHIPADCSAPPAVPERADLVVAYGLGIEPAVAVQSERWLLVGPLFDLWPVADLLALPDPAAEERLHGAPWPDGCDDLGVQLARWAAVAPAPMPLASLAGDVHIVFSQGDQLATTEAIVPVLDALPDASLHRVSVGGWTGRDLSHHELLAGRRGRRAARKGLRRLLRNR